jgi:predicted Rossmann fold nucleotide-binding protein DprA/Smf involved in DNA uptake
MSVAGDVVKTLQARLTEIEEKLDPLLKEADELRDALRRLLGNERQGSPGRRRTGPSTGTSARRARPRARRGRTREAILEAIKSEPKTAGQIAKETGLNRGTISTTLTKLTKEGAAVKAERGYRAA